MKNITLLNKKSLQLADLAPREDSRYTLRALCITSKETVVTDDHILVRVSHPTIKPENFPTLQGFSEGSEFQEVLLSVEAAKTISQAIPNEKAMSVLNHAAMSVGKGEGSTSLQFAVTNLETHQMFTPRAMTGQYPNWKAAIPTCPPKHQVTVSPVLLGKLCKYACQFTKEEHSPSMRLSFSESDRAIRLDVESGGQGMTALLMPMSSSADYSHCLPLPEAEAAPDPFAGYDFPVERPAGVRRRA